MDEETALKEFVVHYGPFNDATVVLADSWTAVADNEAYPTESGRRTVVFWIKYEKIAVFHNCHCIAKRSCIAE